jgi:hypothetical protein
MSVRTVVQRGPKGKRAVAFAVDWPGWSRGAKTADDAVALLESYRERYLPVAAAAGLELSGPLEVVEDAVGVGSVDFWGISFSPSSLEVEPVPDLERSLALVQASWAFFDEVAARVSPEMRRGPRGGGRDRAEIVRHTLRTESLDFAKKVGVRVEDETTRTPEGLRGYRDSYLAALRAYGAGELKPMRSWNLPFLVRHTAFHTMDHAWEMEDKDLSGAAQA